MSVKMMKLEQPGKEQMDSIYNEFDTSPQHIRKDVQMLMEWFEKQPHLSKITDEEFLEHSLLRCRNSIEQVKYILDRYLSLKTALPEIYNNRDPTDKNLVECMKCIAFIPMPELTPDCCRVSIFHIVQPNKHETINPDDVIKSMYMSADLRLRIDNSHSDIFIFDMENFSMPVIALVMANLRKFLLPGTKGIPMRQKQYYIINASPSAESIIMMAKSIIRKDLMKKLVVLKDSQELHNVIPKKCLPKEYGGDQPSFLELNDAWIATLQHYKDWFKEQDNIKADNSKRLTRDDSRLGDLPLEGSFRRITID